MRTECAWPPTIFIKDSKACAAFECLIVCGVGANPEPWRMKADGNLNSIHLDKGYKRFAI